MRKTLLIFAIAFLSCRGEEQKQMSKVDSLSVAIDNSRENDTLLQRLRKENNNP